MLGASAGLQTAQSPKAGCLKNRMSLVDDGYQHRCNEIGFIKPLQSDVVYSCISAAVLTGSLSSQLSGASRTLTPPVCNPRGKNRANELVQ